MPYIRAMTKWELLQTFPGGVLTSEGRLGVQVAVRSNQLGVAYFNAAVDLAALLAEGGALEPAAFVPAWKALPDALEAAEALPVALGAWPQASARLAAANVFTMAHKAVPGARPPFKNAWCCLVSWQPLTGPMVA